MYATKTIFRESRTLERFGRISSDTSFRHANWASINAPTTCGMTYNRKMDSEFETNNCNKSRAQNQDFAMMIYTLS